MSIPAWGGRTPGPREAVSGWFLAAVTAASAAAQVPPPVATGMADGRCILQSITVAVEGGETVLEIAIDGHPASLGAHIDEHDAGVVLDLSGCVAGPESGDRSFTEGLVSAVTLLERSASTGPVTAVAVAAREPIEYTVSSTGRGILVRLQPNGLAPAPRRQIRVLEPLSLPPPAAAEPPIFEVPAGPGARRGTAEAVGSAEDVSEIEARIEAWARAWSDQRIDDYLSFYASAFQPAEGSRDEWETLRRQRVAAPGFIEVGLDGLSIFHEASDRAAVSFWQSYTSDGFSDLVYKTLIWISEGGTWKIASEETVTPPERSPRS